MEVDVFAGLFSGKERQVLRMLLGWVVQNGPRIKTSLRNGHIVFDHCWIRKKNYTSVWNHIRFYFICVKRLLWSMSFCWYLDKWQQQSLVNDITGAIRVNISLTLNMMNVWPTYTRIQTLCPQHWVTSKPHCLKELSLYCLVFSWHGEKCTKTELVHALCLGSTRELESGTSLNALCRKIWADNGH